MLPISVSVYIYQNFLCRHSVYICIGKIFLYNYVSLYVFVIFYHFVFLFLFICFPLCNQLSHRYWKKYSNSCNGCEVKKVLIKVANDIWLPLQHLQMWRGFFLTLEWWWRIGEPCYCWRGSTRSSFFGRILLCWILN